MKRTDSGMLAPSGCDPALCAAPKTRQTCPAAEEPALSDSLLSLSSSIESGYETSSEIIAPDATAAAAAAPRKRVSWAPTADVRVVYCGSESPCDDTKEDHWVSIEGDGEDDEDSGTMADTAADDDDEDTAVDPEEAAIRSQLVGCLCSKKQRRRRRRYPNYAAMHGCGTCVHSSCTVTSAECSDSDDDDDDDDSDFVDDDKPIRVIVACSVMESSIDSIFTFT